MISPDNIQTAADTLSASTSLLSSLATFIPTAIGVSSVLAAFLPPPESPGLWGHVHKAINMLAFNFNHAKNKE